MSVYEHNYGIPSEDELAALVGAATPHFAFQILERVQAYSDALPPDHSRQPGLSAHLARLDRLGFDGETGREHAMGLPPRASVPGLH